MNWRKYSRRLRKRSKNEYSSFILPAVDLKEDNITNEDLKEDSVINRSNIGDREDDS